MNPIRHRWSSRFAYREAAAVVAISSAVAAEVRRFDPNIAGPTIPSAYRPASPATGLHRALRERWGSSVVVGNVAALENDSKGQLTLINLARELPMLRVVLVGSGRDEAMLKRAAAGLENVEFTGQVGDVDAYLRAFDLFAFPSLREGFGSVLLDAMRHGLPVIAKRSGGIVDIVQHGTTGLLVDADDDAGFVDAVRDLAADLAARQRYAAAARHAVERFAPAIMATAYAELYREILAGTDATEMP